MRVHQSGAAEVVKARAGLVSSVVQDTPATSFAAALAKSSAGKKTEALPEGPKGETTRAVEHRDYAEITSGPRNGMFINTSDNDRRGETFVLKKKDDHDLHIYGSGEDRRVIAVPHERGPEKTRPVEGHPYDEITSGARNGMFINRTGNERSGEAFALVKQDDRDLHIYGTGKDRSVIVSWHKDQPAHGTDDAEQDAKVETGGTSAPAKSGA